MLLLPTEVILAILRHVLGKDLKSTRLACKRLARLAEESLFREIIIVPHLDSFKQLIKLTEHTTLRRHVQRLIYDTRLLGAPLEIKIEMEAMGHFRYGKDATQTDLHAFLKYHERRSLKKVEQAKQEIQYLVRVFRSLPSLRAFTIGNEAQYDITNTTLPQFYKRMIEKLDGLDHNHFDTMGKTTHRSRSFLLAAHISGLELHDLRLEGIAWRQIFDLSELREPSRYLKVVSRIIRDSKLTSAGKSFNTPEDTTVFISQALDYTLNVKSLDLRISDACILKPKPQESSMFTQLSLLPSRLQLEALCLSNFTADEHELVEFVLCYSATLTSLRLEDARLLQKRAVNTDEAGTSRACWVSVFQQLAAGLHLKTASLSGTLSNGGNQYWQLSAANQHIMIKEGSKSLKSSVEYFLVQEGNCPLARVAVEPGQLDVRCPNPLWRGDASFLMDYKDRELEDDN